MAGLLIICSLAPATQEQWRRLFQDIAGSRREQFEASCQQAGISKMEVWLTQLRRGELLLIRLHVQQPRQALLVMANSQRPFERWLRAQLQSLFGLSVQEALSEQQELLFTWPGESADS